MDKLHGQSENTVTACKIEKTSGFMQENEEKKNSGCETLIICRDVDGGRVMQSEAGNFQGGLVVAADDFYR